MLAPHPHHTGGRGQASCHRPMGASELLDPPPHQCLEAAEHFEVTGTQSRGWAWSPVSMPALPLPQSPPRPHTSTLQAPATGLQQDPAHFSLTLEGGRVSRPRASGSQMCPWPRPFLEE